MRQILSPNAHGWLALPATTLAVLLFVAGCSRDRGDRVAAEPRQQTATNPEAVSDVDVGEPTPSIAAMEAERVAPTKIRAAEAAPKAMRKAMATRTARASQSISPAAKARPRTLKPKAFSATAMTEEVAVEMAMPMEMAAEDSMEMAMPMEMAAMESHAARASAQPQPSNQAEHRSGLPAGAQHQSEQGFSTVQVFYATDRQRSAVPLSGYEVSGHQRIFFGLGGCAMLLIALAALSAAFGRTRTGTIAVVAGSVSACAAAAFVVAGQANIEKHGVTYTGDRGTLTRGICEVTVPDSHQRGMVERPSLLRFEIHEDKEKHVVLTSAVELAADDFKGRLIENVAGSPDRDLLVFIHGYNVDFNSAVRRTAQIAVDLPFEGVPVCYSWPSQGSLLGYSVDENNAEWTIPHLKKFLLELANECGAESINVIAHSMGNRAMTAAMQQISLQGQGRTEPPFDRIVLAAPDVDADRFRRDFAPSLRHVANHVTLYASSDDQALVASKQVHGYPRAGESGANIVVVPGVDTIDVSGIDLSLLGHSYYGDNESMLRDLYEVVRSRLPAPKRGWLIPKASGPMTYWQLAQQHGLTPQGSLR